MDNVSLGNVAYLVLLLIAIGGWMIAANRHQLGKMAQQAAIWGFIFLGTIAAFGLWSDIRDDVAPRAAVIGNTIEIPRGLDGHYHLTLGLNGTPVDFVIDTGASDMVLSMQDAARIGLDPESLAFTGMATTANGTVRTARVRIAKVQLGDATETNVPASVTQGEMQGSLLGMSYLQRFARIEITGNKMILER
ncbi:retropepsin-like aspartic protease family protein [Frigidibacter sp. ROC022]|uniref:retropepsin-like aspartic protease family protein n=1 Tax=Frigidibacter sp. ROC022 TaxID=2971796 RepID=UPI00215AAC84|nr:TIGR02281 family clan AA aspartic protease [Frigidibacter sp. ROC022]MCR8725637.1 TIGR02281 family clan AA aspartic protease [Frigidibacter sp. ROC022]